MTKVTGAWGWALGLSRVGEGGHLVGAQAVQYRSQIRLPGCTHVSHNKHLPFFIFQITLF